MCIKGSNRSIGMASVRTPCARRGVKLEKPQPRKRISSCDETLTDGAVTKPHSAPPTLMRSISEGSAGVPKYVTNNEITNVASTGRRAARMIKLQKPSGLGCRSNRSSESDSTSELEETTKQRPVFYSQMSEDSGVEDLSMSSSFNSNSYSELRRRQLSQTDDDLDWDDLDNTEPFIFGEKQMKCTAFYINQKFPCNGTVLPRSYSMPTDRSTKTTISPSSTEFWGDDLIPEDNTFTNKPTVISTSCDNSKSTNENWDDCYNNNKKTGPKRVGVSEDYCNNNIVARKSNSRDEQTGERTEQTAPHPLNKPCLPKMCVIHQREPLREDSSLEEIWKVEEELGGGKYTARDRRCHFRNYKLCQQDYEIILPNLRLQYTIEELKEIGYSKLARCKPNNWTIITQKFPDICITEAEEKIQARQGFGKVDCEPNPELPTQCPW